MLLLKSFALGVMTAMALLVVMTTLYLAVWVLGWLFNMVEGKYGAYWTMVTLGMLVLTACFTAVWYTALSTWR